MKKAILFDLDNTLTHRNRSISVYAAQLLSDFEFVDSSITVEDVTKIILQQDNGGYQLLESPYSTIKEAVSSEIVNNFTFATKTSASNIERHWVENFPKCSVEMPGAQSLLDSLSKMNYTLAIISNGAHLSRQRTVNTLGFNRYIDLLVSSEKSNCKKPNKEIFTETAVSLGIAANECWYVGDHPINDILGAKNAGMKTIWLTGFHLWPVGLTLADKTVSSLSEITDILRP